MSQDNNHNSNRPTHNVYIIRETGREKPFWDKIGAAWEHKDKKGFTQKLDVLGLNAELVVRVNQPKPNRHSKQKAQDKHPKP